MADTGVSACVNNVRRRESFRCCPSKCTQINVIKEGFHSYSRRECEAGTAAQRGRHILDVLRSAGPRPVKLQIEMATLSDSGDAAIVTASPASASV